MFWRARIVTLSPNWFGTPVALQLTAATLGRREAALPGPRTGLVLEGDVLRVRPEARAKWSRFGLTVGSRGAVVGSSGAAGGTPLAVPLPFPEAADLLLQVRVPASAWTGAVRDLRPWLLAAAALLGAFVAVLIGARFVRRARRIRVKLRAALGAAAVIPFCFLFVGLSTLLNDRAESDLRAATLAHLRTAAERVAAAPSRARALAARANDLLRLSDAGRDEIFHRLLETVRADLQRSDGAFLLLPDGDAARPSPIGNVDFFDSLTRSGLYFSPWDGLVAVGITRNERHGRVLVGLPGAALLAARAPDDFLMLFGPSGRRIAAAGAVPPQVQENAPPHIQDGLAAGAAAYEPRAAATGAHAAGYEVLRDGARPLGLLGLYRSRAGTDSSLAGIRNALLLAGLAALLLVILAGETLADRVTHPLGRVMSAAGELAAGHLTRH